jgi:hypothetical protein
MYQTIVLINLLQAGFWIITEDFRGSEGDKFSYPVRKHLGLPTPLAVRCKAYICDRSIAEIADLNPAKGMDVSLFCLLCCLGSGLCDKLITHLGSLTVCVCDKDTPTMSWRRLELGSCAIEEI